MEDNMRVYKSAFSKASLGLALIAVAGLPDDAMANRSMVLGAQSWSYQLQGSGKVAGSNADVIVVDQSESGRVGALKQKPGGGRRAVISYLAIGEAETYRSYYKSCCSPKRPDWHTDRTQGWQNNYIVKFWAPEWKDIVRERVRQIVAAGFDGMYLDRVDTWERVKHPSGSSRSEMIQLVKEVSSYARGLKSDFAIIAQNGEELLTDGGYVAAIDAVAKESLMYGVPTIGQRNSASEVSHSANLLRSFKSKGKAVFVVEYISSNESVASEIRKFGFVPHFGSRALN
jgi:cysteinyl-tRNA synthetase, unknown class